MRELSSSLADPLSEAAAESPLETPGCPNRGNVGDASSLPQPLSHRERRQLFERQRGLLDGLQGNLRFFSPLRHVQTERQRLDELSRRGNAAQAHRLALERSQIEGLGRRLSALNPLAVLGRGYAVVTHKREDRIVSSKSSVKAGDDLSVRVTDGEFDVRVTQ